jgi:hypothetical protein
MSAIATVLSTKRGNVQRHNNDLKAIAVPVADLAI